MSRLILNTVIVLFFIFNAFNNDSVSQVNPQWVVRYNNPSGDDWQESMVVDDSGNVYLTGYANGNSYLTIKYNTVGELKWAESYPGGKAYAIAVDSSGSVYVTGYGTELGNFCFATLKYNPSGLLQWERKFNRMPNSNDIARSIALDGFGNVYVTGDSEDSTQRSNALTIKYNSDGVQQWIAIDTLETSSKSIVTDSYGNIYITGSVYYNNDQSYDYLTIKYNSDGEQQWLATYNGTGNYNDFAQSIAIDNLGNVFVTGESPEPKVLNRECVTIKYNPDGVQQWTARDHRFGFWYNMPKKILVDQSGNAYIAGESYSNASSLDYLLIKYSSTGVQQWVELYNGPLNSYDKAYSMVLDSSGNSYITGYSFNNETGADIVTIKFNTDGIQQWLTRYSKDPRLEGHSIALDKSGNVYVSGIEINGQMDYITLKYSQLIGITQSSSEFPDDYILFQNYPNPFNPLTRIGFNILKQSYISLKIYDVLGNEIKTLVNEYKPAGVYQVNFDGDDLSSGIYFYRLSSGNSIQTKSMVLIK